MKVKMFVLLAGLTLAGWPSFAAASPSAPVEMAAASLTNRILKAVAVEFQQMGYDYTVEYLQREYEMGNVTIEELGSGEYRVTVGGGDTIIVILEDFS